MPFLNLTVAIFAISKFFWLGNPALSLLHRQAHATHSKFRRIGCFNASVNLIIASFNWRKQVLISSTLYAKLL